MDNSCKSECTQASNGEPVGDLASFIKAVAAQRNQWDLATRSSVWFRGEDRDFGKQALTPRLYRQTLEHPLRDRTNFLQREGWLFEQFRTVGAGLAHMPNDPDEWQWYVLMQHHGCPTRLLDWTENALAALYFAVRGRASQTDQSPAVVYMLHKEIVSRHFPQPIETEKDQYPLDRYLPLAEGDEDTSMFDDPTLIDIDHMTPRIAAQRSRFVVFGKNLQSLGERLTSGCLRGVSKISVDGNFKNIIEELRACGTTESSIFQDLDGLGRELDAIWEQMSSEDSKLRSLPRRRRHRKTISAAAGASSSSSTMASNTETL